MYCNTNFTSKTLLIRLLEIQKIIHTEIKHNLYVLSKNKLWPYVMEMVNVEIFFSLWYEALRFMKTFAQNLNIQAQNHIICDNYKNVQQNKQDKMKRTGLIMINTQTTEPPICIKTEVIFLKVFNTFTTKAQRKWSHVFHTFILTD